MWDPKIHFRPCLISALVRFILIFSYVVAEAPDQHHGGPGRIMDGRNGLTGPNRALHSRDLKGTNSTYCFGGLKEGLWSILC